MGANIILNTAKTNSSCCIEDPVVVFKWSVKFEKLVIVAVENDVEAFWLLRKCDKKSILRDPFNLKICP